jgi:4-hydroxybenzoyl-CoA thioesterase
MSCAFRSERRIRFSDCDPAGIVFYPQYFVLFNGVLEDWVDALGIGFSELVTHRRIGLPSVRIEADFQAISRFGDTVSLQLQVERVGDKSLTLGWRCVAADSGEVRMTMRQVLVTTCLERHRAIPIPQDLRAAIEAPRLQSAPNRRIP